MMASSGKHLSCRPSTTAEGEIYGMEFTATYTTGGFSTYANIAYSVARGKDWSSAQFLFDPTDVDYVRNQLDFPRPRSAGHRFLRRVVSLERERGSSRVYVDALYGSGLRTDATAADGSNIPTAGRSHPITRSIWASKKWFKIGSKQRLKARLDVVNITDNIYVLRNGSGVGVNAAQYGMRLGFFGTFSYVF